MQRRFDPNYMISQRPNIEVGKYFGTSPQSVTNTITRIENKISDSDELRKEVERFKCIM